MHPIRSTMAVLATITLALAALSPLVFAQEDAAEHPIVGAWWVRPEMMPAAEGPGNLGSFGADGIFVGVDPGGGVGIGAWRSTGEQTFEATFHFPIQDPDREYVGHGTVSVSGEVSEDGQTFSGTATTDVPLPEGGRSGPRGQAPLIGTRVTVGSVLPSETPSEDGSPAAPEASPQG